MSSTRDRSPTPARIEYLRVQNFRALRHVELKELTPLTVLLGPNGSGKSTVFDVFAFLSECFELGLRRAWDKRGRAKELKSRGGDGPVTIEVKYKEPDYPPITYHLAVDERHGDRLERIFEVLRQRVPRIERVLADTMPDGRLLLQVKDAPFSHPVMARFASDGTLKMLAYLVLLYDPSPPSFIGIEEPENFLHPRLLPELAEECRAATTSTQLLVTTHSPFFLNALRPREVRVLWRDESGYTQTQRASDVPGIPEFMEEGALLGHLWMEGQLGVGDPLVNQGAPTRPTTSRRRA